MKGRKEDDSTVITPHTHVLREITTNNVIDLKKKKNKKKRELT